MQASRWVGIGVSSDGKVLDIGEEQIQVYKVENYLQLGHRMTFQSTLQPVAL